MSRWQLVSTFGESVFLTPCALLLFAWLRGQGDTAGARHWLLAFCMAALLVLVSKLAFLGWGIGSATLDFTGFSGHAMMAASVIPVILYFAMPTRLAMLAPVAAVAGVLAALMVAASRLALHAHSVSEVVGGLALGLAVSIPFLLRKSAPREPLTMLLTVVGLVTVLALPTERAVGVTHTWVEALAVCLSGRDRPFQRGEWASSMTARWPSTGASHPGRGCPRPLRT